MDVKKYTTPNLPTNQNILEDIATADDKVYDFNFEPEDEILKKAYKCYHSFENLQNDSIKRSELKQKLDELNKKLVESIQSINHKEV